MPRQSPQRRDKKAGTRYPSDPAIVRQAGPSGRLGFQDSSVLNFREERFDHGTHFEPETMIVGLADGGLWDRFLRLPLASLEEDLGSYRPVQEWHQAHPLLQYLTWGAAVLLLMALIAGSVAVIVAGVAAVASWIF